MSVRNWLSIISYRSLTLAAFNNSRKYIKAIMNELLHTDNNTRCMEYYSDSITPSIIKVYGITAKINSHSKFFQGKYTSTKRNTY